jgi:4-carboxymuconolactone decarboxylase
MRLAKLSYDELSPQQKTAWDAVVAGPRKKMHGPFFIWLHSAELLSRGEKLGLYARFQSSLPQRLSELCILMIAAHWKAAGEWIDHAPIARELGVDGHALEALRQGLPAEFKRDVSDATYARVKAVLGERAILDLVAVLGYYSLIAMSMKTFALQAEGVPDPFKE